MSDNAEITTDLQVVGTTQTQNQPTPSMIPTDHEMTCFKAMAAQAVASNLYRGLGSEAAIVMNMLAARELGLPPMLALNGGLNIIQGKVEISARAMNAMIRRAGHSIQEKTSTDTVCELVGRRCDNSDTITCSFSMDEARQAGLIKAGGGWTKFPKDMLYARCLSRLARRLFADVIGVGYIEGELSDPGANLRPSRRFSEESLKTESPEVIEAAIIEDDSAMRKTFFDRFNHEEVSSWEEYIQTIQEKQKLTFTSIVAKYEENPEAARAKYTKWLEKRNKAAIK